MDNPMLNADESALEEQEWLQSLDEVLNRSGPERVRALFQQLAGFAQEKGVRVPFATTTPYVNTIPPAEQPPYPGDLELECRIGSLIRWNAMAMVVKANREQEGIGGHIATYASIATLYEVGFNHFFRGNGPDRQGDFVYFQGHSSPGIYARAFLEGRLPVEQVNNFRHELRDGPGLSSYPHPWLMPEFWTFPTVSMGLGPIQAIYHARFIKYLQDRGLKAPSAQKVWAFLGDGECDEPEALGAIALAAREKLDNLIFVVNCNLQRLDGPVRGNGKIIQELESTFRGAGWHVIKVIWGSDWDALLARDERGLLAQRMNEVVDGQYQKYVVEDGAYFRKDFFGKDPRLLDLVRHLSDEQLKGLLRGGHDPVKVYAAYKAATETRGGPSVVLAQTVKGFGMGDAGEGLNITHQQKKLKDPELLAFRSRFHIPLSDEQVGQLPFCELPAAGPEKAYLLERREALGGFTPQRHGMGAPLELPDKAFFKEFLEGTEGREVSTTMAFVRILAKLLKDEKAGKLIVPIVPDEARTFGMAALFRQCGIYSHAGQLYEPVDAENLLYYKEATDGQILEEGITEAGSLSSFIAAGTAYSNHGINTIPFFIFYSMFGFQRVGDLIWAAADSRCKGFLLGATSGRTTLAGEGLQHQDGNSHLLALTVPNVMAYDPAYAYELAIILQDGLKRMYVNKEDLIYYITLMNENYAQPPMPEGAAEGILRGMYRLTSVEAAREGAPRVRLLGSGTILNEVLKAAGMLARDYGVSAEVYSVTSYKELYKDAQETERWNMRYPDAEERRPHVATCLGQSTAPVVAASDYVKALCGCAARWIPARVIALGTDGFGRSDGRAALRDFFEVDARHVVLAALSALAREGALTAETAVKAREAFGIDSEKPNPIYL
jgi:pyruvate dehydrogenase E1 component